MSTKENIFSKDNVFSNTEGLDTLRAYERTLAEFRIQDTEERDAKTKELVDKLQKIKEKMDLEEKTKEANSDLREEYRKCRNELVEITLGLAYYLLNQKIVEKDVSMNEEEKLDLIQNVNWELVKIAGRYNPKITNEEGRNAKFSTFVWNSLEPYINGILIRMMSERTTISMDDEENIFTYFSSIDTTEEWLDRQESRNKLQRSLAKLSEEQRKIIMTCCGDNPEETKAFHKVAVELGMSDNKLKFELNKIREIISKNK